MIYKEGMEIPKETYSTGATRSPREGKIDFGLVPYDALKRLAAVYTRGAEKHGRNNWRKGIPIKDCYEAALRHLLKVIDFYETGTKRGDPEDDQEAQACWNIFAIMFYQAEEKRKAEEVFEKLETLDDDWSVSGKDFNKGDSSGGDIWKGF